MTQHDLPSQDPRRFLTVSEVAVELRISRASVYRLLHDGTLGSNRFGKSLRVSRDAVDAYISSSVNGARPAGS
ncbi:excisionase family DNA binding protein [Pseudonocardia sediminis]|uniref:Excisionase family DNA binding protein n=1 Tax=Pseudonocardia sediminis TaxID=1397368 RepID=A0A4Q7UYT5_PSEST|nr:helix-turn-helix domain-containing protein [Pseudonocardia sediminis]RZT87297.1 excisionase family DNA binding protein [Pseudonocardia sediminis]